MKPYFVVILILLVVPFAAQAEKYELKCPSVSIKNDFAKFTSKGSGWSGAPTHQITLGCGNEIRNNEMVCYHKLGGMGPAMYRSTRKIPEKTRCKKSRYACRFDCWKEEVMEQSTPKPKSAPLRR